MARLQYSYLFLAILVGLSGCSGSNSAAPAAGSSDSGGDETSITRVKAIDIGDVEQGLRITALLSPRSASSNVSNNEVIDRSKRVNFVTLTVNGEKEDLFLALHTEPRRPFTSNPVAFKAVLRTEVTMPGDDEPTVSRKDIYYGKFITQTAKDFAIAEIDVLEDIEGRPLSILAQMEVTAIMTPVGTDFASIDIDDFENIEGQRTSLLGNPVRIDFVN